MLSLPHLMQCRVELSQIDPTLGNLDANLAMHIAQARSALQRGAQLVLFPELSLTGYFLRDQTPEVALRVEDARLQPLRELSREVTLGFGFVERGSDERLYNSYALFEDGRVIGIHRKVHLVTYGMFDDARDFAPGEDFRIVESRHGRLGILICEDMWHFSAAWLHFLAEADAIIVPSASPGRGIRAGGEEGLHSARVWNRLQDAMALLFQTWILYVNRAGSEDGLIFSGGSRVVDPFGEETARLPLLETGSLSCQVDSETLRRARVATPLRRDEKPQLVAAEIARICGQRGP